MVSLFSSTSRKFVHFTFRKQNCVKRRDRQNLYSERDTLIWCRSAAQINWQWSTRFLYSFFWHVLTFFFTLNYPYDLMTNSFLCFCFACNSNTVIRPTLSQFSKPFQDAKAGMASSYYCCCYYTRYCWHFRTIDSRGRSCDSFRPGWAIYHSNWTDLCK